MQSPPDTPKLPHPPVGRALTGPPPHHQSADTSIMMKHGPLADTQLMPQKETEQLTELLAMVISMAATKTELMAGTTTGEKQRICHTVTEVDGLILTGQPMETECIGQNLIGRHMGTGHMGTGNCSEHTMRIADTEKTTDLAEIDWLISVLHKMVAAEAESEHSFAALLRACLYMLQ